MRPLTATSADEADTEKLPHPSSGIAHLCVPLMLVAILAAEVVTSAVLALALTP